jgi:hypothetical protein
MINGKSPAQRRLSSTTVRSQTSGSSSGSSSPAAGYRSWCPTTSEIPQLRPEDELAYVGEGGYCDSVALSPHSRTREGLPVGNPPHGPPLLRQCSAPDAVPLVPAGVGQACLGRSTGSALSNGPMRCWPLHGVTVGPPRARVLGLARNWASLVEDILELQLFRLRLERNGPRVVRRGPWAHSAIASGPRAVVQEARRRAHR